MRKVSFGVATQCIQPLLPFIVSPSPSILYKVYATLVNFRHTNPLAKIRKLLWNLQYDAKSWVKLVWGAEAGHMDSCLYGWLHT